MTKLGVWGGWGIRACSVPGRFVLKLSFKTKQTKKPRLVIHRPCSLIKSHLSWPNQNVGSISQLALDKTRPPVGKVPFSSFLVPGKAAFKLEKKKTTQQKQNKNPNPTKKVWIIAQSHWPRWGGFLSLLKNRPRTKPDGSRLLALFNALPPTDGSPFALLPPPSFRHPPLGLSVLRLEIIFYCPVVRKWPFALD